MQTLAPQSGEASAVDAAPIKKEEDVVPTHPVENVGNDDTVTTVPVDQKGYSSYVSAHFVDRIIRSCFYRITWVD